MEKTIDITLTVPQTKSAIDALSYALSFQMMTIDEDCHIRKVIDLLREELDEQL